MPNRHFFLTPPLSSATISISMDILNSLSLVLEAMVAIMGVWIGIAKKKLFGWLIALTFIIYVIYDLSRFLNISLPAHDFLFLTASVSIFIAVLMIARQK